VNFAITHFEYANTGQIDITQLAFGAIQSLAENYVS
jgi:hypothetical protein